MATDSNIYRKCFFKAFAGKLLLGFFFVFQFNAWAQKEDDGLKIFMLCDMDETVDGFILMGHHAKAGTEGSFLPHTQTLSWADFRINGQSVGEIGLEACYAGHWNIPLILVQGDEATCKEAEEQFPGVITAEVKRSESNERAVGLDPHAVRKLTAEKITEAITKLRKGGRFTTFKTSLPMTVTVQMTSADAAQKAAQRPGVHRVDQKTVEGRVAQQAEVIKWITGAGLDMRE